MGCNDGRQTKGRVTLAPMSKLAKGVMQSVVGA